MKKKLVTCDIGVTLPETLARKVDEITKTLPNNRKYLKKAALPQTFELEPESRTDVSYITTECVDREGDVVLRAGIDKALFDENPVVLWMHDSSVPAIGRCLWIKPQGLPLDDGTVEKGWISDSGAVGVVLDRSGRVTRCWCAATGRKWR